MSDVDLAELRESIEGFESEFETLLLGHLTTGVIFNPAPLYEKYPIFTKENVIAMVRTDMAGKFVEQYLDLRLRDVKSKISEMESEQTVMVDGVEKRVNELGNIALKESDRDRKRSFFGLYLDKVEKLNPIRAEVVERLQEEAVHLGYPHYLYMWSLQTGINPDNLKEQCRSFLRKTRSSYRSRMKSVAEPELTVPVRQAEMHDIRQFFSHNRFEPYFGKVELRNVVDVAFKNLGMELSHNPAIRISEGSSACCIPISVPDNIAIVYKQEDGYRAYGSMLHEAAHALHFANMDPLLPIEKKVLGDYSTGEGYAFLAKFMGKDFMMRKSGMQDKETIRKFLKISSIDRLRDTRYFAAMCLYLLELYEKGVERGRDVYSKILNNALLNNNPPELFLKEISLTRFATYFRGCLLGAILNDSLTSNYGKNWNEKESSGDYLKHLMSQGMVQSEVIAGMCGRRLTEDCLVNELRVR